MNKNNINSNGYRDEKSFCYFHPRQLVVGVCPLCLNERLLLLAAKQGHHRTHSASKPSSHNTRIQSSVHRKTTATTSSSSSIHKIFAFGSLFTRHEPQQWKSETINFEYDASPSPEESFISIKFEENGVASWEKNTVPNKVSLENCNWNHHTALQIQNKDTNTNNKSMIEHGKSRDRFRWRKRIGHMFHLIRWRRTGGVCHVSSKVEGGVKVRKGGWMRTLTKRKKKKTVE